METTVLERESITQTYLDVEKLIYKTCWKFKERYGGDFEEWNAEANFIFLSVYSTYNKTKSAFSTWLCFTIWRGLLDKLKKDNKHSFASIETIDLGKVAWINPSFKIIELLDELSEDAKTIVKLICDPPKKLREQAIKKGTKPRNLRSTLKQFLQNEMGWPVGTVRDSFIEIRRVLNG